MNLIWKFGLEIQSYQEIMMPVGANILCVKNQNSKPCIWAICDNQVLYEQRKFRIYGTGEQFQDVCGDYIGTVQTNINHTEFVWHIFEVFVETK